MDEGKPVHSLKREAPSYLIANYALGSGRAIREQTLNILQEKHLPLLVARGSGVVDKRRV